MGRMARQLKEVRNELSALAGETRAGAKQLSSTTKLTVLAALLTVVVGSGGVAGVVLHQRDTKVSAAEAAESTRANMLRERELQLDSRQLELSQLERRQDGERLKLQQQEAERMHRTSELDRELSRKQMELEALNSRTRERELQIQLEENDRERLSRLVALSLSDEEREAWLAMEYRELARRVAGNNAALDDARVLDAATRLRLEQLVVALDLHVDRLPEQFLLRGNAEYQLRKYSSAAATFERGLAVAPHDTSLRCNLATTLLQLDDPVRALAQIDIALAREPSNSTFLSVRGRALRMSGRLIESEAAFRLSLRSLPTYGAWVNLANLLNDMTRFVEAMRCADSAIDIFDGPEVRVARAVALLGLGRASEAEDDLCIALPNIPNHLRHVALSTYANALLRLGHSAKALELAEDAVRDSPHDFIDAYANRGAAFGMLGQYSLAIADFVEVLKRRPDDLRNWVVKRDIGAALYASRSYTTGRDILFEVRAQRPSDAATLYYLTFILSALGDYEAAVQSLSDLAKVAPEMLPELKMAVDLDALRADVIWGPLATSLFK